MSPTVHRVVAALSVLASAITLGVSYSLPTISYQALSRARETYSIWGGIESLWRDGNHVLAPVVFLFSMIFPVGKLLSLALVLTPALKRRTRGRWLEWLHLLGKWSMLDVFIVAVFVAAVQLDLLPRDGDGEGGLPLATSTSRWGIHVFALAIVMSMWSAWLVGRLEGSFEAGPAHAGLRTATGRGLATARAGALVAMLALPLLEVRRTIEAPFGLGSHDVENQVHLWRTTARLGREGELLLALVLALFVIAIPIARALCSLRLRWLAGEGRRALRVARGLDAWAMVDVIGLGLVIVQVKLAELTTCDLLSGFWWTLAAAVLALAESWHLRRACR